MTIAPVRRKSFCRKTSLIVLWFTTAIFLPLLGLGILVRIPILDTSIYNESSCFLRTAELHTTTRGYTIVWKDDTYGCSVIQSPLSWYPTKQSALEQSTIYPLGKTLRCWCNYKNFYEFPVVGEFDDNELIATCFLDGTIISYMQLWKTFVSLGWSTFCGGLVIAISIGVFLAFHCSRPIYERY